ncbi:hypothetical protein QTP70_007905 [Hemibagrus guttatus]|uniref:Ig-like domain-containing protein n=1 Tax=Hemibagrus guttatus TaxID=175788 RepID=A0AAE0Q0C9_9TELE|nr:hypothetical protein QTP70_007905 [Hemibagrus guttatus]
MIEGKRYTLQCDIQGVSPVQLLTVNWYKGEYLVPKAHFTEIEISPSRNDTETPYSCEAELGLQKSIKVRSNPLKITVLYKPIITEKVIQRVPLFHGYPVVLSCVAIGYPEPTITWIFNNEISEVENLTVKEETGEYTCVAVNPLGNDTKVVTVVMEEDYLPLIAGFVAVVVVIISVIFILIYSIYYKNTKMGHYTVEGAKPNAQNGNIAQNGKDGTIPMKKILV